MSIRVSSNKEIENIYVSVNGEKKSIISAYVNVGGTIKKVFGMSTNSESDSYETAPLDAYVNWNYTLNDETNTIILNYYKGLETDVIVYASYEIDGILYKTQIASNGSSATYASQYMFNGYTQKKCREIKSIKFSKNIDTSNITNMSYMFNYCYALNTLDISNFITINVISMEAMFQYCPFTDLDLTNFNTHNVKNMKYMFSHCVNLEKIYATENKWSSSQADTKYMFASCGTSSVIYK